MAARTQPAKEPKRESVAAYLASHRLFGVLPPEAVAELATHVVRRTYSRGHYLYHTGDPASFVFMVRSGIVALTELDDQGRQHPVQTFSPGDVFGLATVVLGSPRRFNASALTDFEALLLPANAFHQQYARSPQLAYQVVRELATMLCRSEQTTFHLGMTPVSSRVARFLLDSATRRKTENARTETLTVDLSRQDLALVLGTSRETVTRVLSRLSRAGILDTRGHKFIILRPDELQRLAEG